MTDNQFTRDRLKGRLSTAEQAAREAGDFLARNRRSGVQITSNRRRDVKLKADLASEEIILQILLANGGIPVLTEERGQVDTKATDDDLRWIVDPLDGTMNYLKGIPLCCVSVGLWRGDQPLLGVIYDFNHEELFTGVVGEGAWFNESEIKVSQISERGNAVLCTGFPVSTDFSPSSLTRFIGQVRQYKKVRLLGSAALSLCYVASGRADSYYERDIKIWDVAAGLALVKAAGGVFFEASSKETDARTVYAGNSALSPIKL